jgi:RimJ/RimL family protein N-acetyltransferase
VAEVLRIAFEEMDLHRVCLSVYAGNRRAMRCYEKCGFRREGVQRKAVLKRGDWIDVVLMAVLREEWTCQRDR